MNLHDKFMNKIKSGNSVKKEIKESVNKNEFLKQAFVRISELIADELHLKFKEINPMELLASHFVTKAFGIIGYPKFLDGHYLYLITKKKKIGKYIGSSIYKIEEVILEMVLNQELSCLNKLGKSKNNEINYIDHFKLFDCTNCYFSYDLDITNTIQSHIISSSKNTYLQFHHKYLWNSHLLKPLNSTIDCPELILPIICGFFSYKTIRIGSREFGIGLISRR